MKASSKFLRSMFAAAAISAAAASPASAAIYDLGTLSDNFSYTNIVYHQPSSSTFSDLFTFTIPESYTADITAFANNLSLFGVIFNIKDLDLSLDQNPGSTSFADLASGNYAFDVSGQSNGFLGGFYGIQLAGNLTPVPEPATYFMLLAGLGLVGMMARRRSSSL